jgi:hypothetical protein
MKDADSLPGIVSEGCFFVEKLLYLRMDYWKKQRNMVLYQNYKKRKDKLL